MTHLPLPAKSPSKNGALLVASISGRALAAAARRAGHRPLVADLFRDCDTVALAERAVKLPGDLHAGMIGNGLVAALRQLAGDERPAALVLGSGFERQPELVESLARQFPVAGCGGEEIRAVKSPDRLARACAELAIPHPELSWRVPPDPENWVVKTSGGAGGSHIGRANGAPLSTGRYFQRFIEGDSVSALFVAAGKDTRIVGFSRQWVARTRSAPYRYGGAVRLRRFPHAMAEQIGGWLCALARHANLVGLCSADFIRSPSGTYTLIEINPRPGATLDIFDDHKAPLITAHLDASAGRSFRLPEFTDAMASMIAYTDAPIASFPAFAWPDWAADRQSPGTQLAAGDPVCTIFARGLSVAATRKALKANALSLQSHWEGGGP